jgi:hypothetical protein
MTSAAPAMSAIAATLEDASISGTGIEMGLANTDTAQPTKSIRVVVIFLIVSPFLWISCEPKSGSAVRE